VKFTRETSTALTVRSVAEAGIRIGDKVYARTIALTADEVLETWTDKAVADLVEDDFATLLDAAPEVVLIGTGPAGEFPPRELTFAMARRGIGLETMDTRAAARTFNVLAGEGRRVAAVLYL
jgi:uncharacterized protein